MSRSISRISTSSGRATKLCSGRRDRRKRPWRSRSLGWSALFSPHPFLFLSFPFPSFLIIYVYPLYPLERSFLPAMHMNLAYPRTNLTPPKLRDAQRYQPRHRQVRHHAQGRDEREGPAEDDRYGGHESLEQE